MMREYLFGRELDYELALTNGWYASRTAGDAWPRIVIPATATSNGRFWQARSMVSGVEPRYQSPFTPREGALIVVAPVRPFTRIAIVEGPMCALAVAGEGCLGVAMMGNQPPNAALDTLLGLPAAEDGWVVIEDADSPGSLSRVVAFLASQWVSVSVRVAYPGKDVSACRPADRARLLK